MTIETSIPLEATAHRLDTLLGEFAETITHIGDNADEVIADTLEQLGDALGVDRTTFESLLDDDAGRRFVRLWVRPGTTSASDEMQRLPIVVHGDQVGTLAVGARRDRCLTSEIESRLRLLGDLIVLAIRRGREARELANSRAEIARLTSCSGQLVNELADASDFEDIIGDSPALRVALSRVQEVAATDASVVLLGETGTGKELFARAIYMRSARRDRPFVRVNCAALPQTLIESELFGHERGAFTGAVATRQGRFELAHRGTIFLDEIGDLPAEVQAKLLRVLQEGEFERVGSSQSRKVDVRVIAATHHNLEAAVAEGRFRPDLYYRLHVYPIALPPLRERVEDIPRLAWFFISRRQRAFNRKFTTIPQQVIAALQQHSWPGNVRELQNVIERAMIHSTGDTLRLDEGPGRHLQPPDQEKGTLEAMERRHIEEALRRCRWRINGAGNAAETLGLHPNTLRFRMKKLGIQRPNAIVSPQSFGRASAIA